jgi:hypothetical protein
MASKYCSSCTQKRLLSFFLSDASNPGSKVLATCNICRAHKTKHNKRKALQPLDPNVPAKRRSTKALTRLNPSIHSLNPVESRLAAIRGCPPVGITAVVATFDGYTHRQFIMVLFSVLFSAC